MTTKSEMRMRSRAYPISNPGPSRKCSIAQLEQRVKHLEDALAAIIRVLVSAGWTGSTLSYAARALGMDRADLELLGLPCPSYLVDQEVKP